MMKLIRVLFVLLISCQLSQAATVDTVSIYSASMRQSFNCVVIKPSSYKKSKPVPVVYLLHGYDGRYSNWIMKVPELRKYADDYSLMIVCPDGGFSSWYFDSPVDPAMKYETYISIEVPAFIDSHYATIKSRYARAITGLSMGGHGGLYIGFRNAGTFGACGSMSGGVDLNTIRNRYDVIKRLGDTSSHETNWKMNSVMNVIESYPKDSLTIIIDCGTEDFFYAANRRLHEKMLKLKIPHDYIERPGKHDWIYWKNAVKYQLLFFHDYFTLKKNNLK